MKVGLTASVKTLANGASGEEDRPLLQGVYINKKEAVVADGYLLVIKQLQPQKMSLEPVHDDKIEDVIVPADALKACKGDEITLQTIESVRYVPSEELLGKDTAIGVNKVVARLDGADFSVEVDAIEGKYPEYDGLFKMTPLIGRVAVNTKVLKKLLRTLPDDAMIQFRVSLPDKPIEFQCQDDDGELPIRGQIMPMNCSWEHTRWKTEDGEGLSERLSK